MPKIRYQDKMYDVPAGHVLMEWVGERSPMDEEWVRFKLVMGHFTREQASLIRHIARHSIVRADGNARRVMKRGNGHGQFPHLSVEKIVWGKAKGMPPGHRGSYIQVVSARDADMILASSSGHEFRVYTEDDATHQGDEKQLVLTPDVRVRLTNRRELKAGVPWERQ